MKKKLFSIVLVGVMALSALTGCSSTKDSGETSGETSGSVVENLYDPAFSIEMLDDGIKKVTDGENRELILVPKELEEVPEEYADSIVIRTPVENAVFLSSTQACAFRAVDNEAVIAGVGGVVGGPDTWEAIPGIKKGLEDGSIIDVGGSSGMGEPDYELIQSLNPDVVFVYTGSSPQTEQIAKFEELGINYAVDNEYMEENYLARMEWMRFILTFFNADEEVDQVMKNAQKTVDEVKAAIEDAGEEKPEVAIFSVSDGTVYATADSSWVGSMLADMGGVNAFSELDTSGGEPLTMEAAFEYVQDSDVIIYTSTPSWCDGLEGIEANFPQITECEAYDNNRVFQYSSIFWMGIDQSDIMAADLAAAIYPDIFPDRELSYYVDLAA